MAGTGGVEGGQARKGSPGRLPLKPRRSGLVGNLPACSVGVGVTHPFVCAGHGAQHGTRARLVDAPLLQQAFPLACNLEQTSVLF